MVIETLAPAVLAGILRKDELPPVLRAPFHDEITLGGRNWNHLRLFAVSEK
jgi:hypothetical protein